MSSAEPRPVPTWSAVVREQFRAVGLGVRKETLLAGGLLLGFSVLFLWVHLRVDPSDDIDAILPEMAMPIILLGLAVPLAVWKSEEPERRTYLWTLGLDRGRHQLMKVAVGWSWYMIAVAVYLGWLIAMAWATGGDIGIQTRQIFLGENFQNQTPEDFLRYSLQTPWWLWLAPFTAGTIAYLLSSILVVGSNHPIRWAAGIWFAGFVTLAIASTNPATESAVERVLEYVLEKGGPIGLTLVFDPDTAVREVLTAGGEPRSIFGWSWRLWLGATSFWLGLGLVGTLIAGLRHREP